MAINHVAVKIKNFRTGRVLNFADMTQAAKRLGVSVSTISRAVSRSSRIRDTYIVTTPGKEFSEVVPTFTVYDQRNKVIIKTYTLKELSQRLDVEQTTIMNRVSGIIPNTTIRKRWRILTYKGQALKKQRRMSIRRSVSVWDTITGEIRTFRSITAASKFFQMNSANQLSIHMKNNPMPRLLYNRFVAKYSCEEFPTKEQIEVLKQTKHKFPLSRLPLMALG